MSNFSHFCVFPSALSNVLFPALSLLAVGGILFLMTNMQVLNSHLHLDTLNLSDLFCCQWKILKIEWKGKGDFLNDATRSWNFNVFSETEEICRFLPHYFMTYVFVMPWCFNVFSVGGAALETAVKKAHDQEPLTLNNSMTHFWWELIQK